MAETAEHGAWFKKSAQLIASRFDSILREWLLPDEYSDMVQENKEDPDTNVCHSHDYCDANVAMMEAFGADFDCDNESHMEAIAEAWNVWKSTYCPR